MIEMSVRAVKRAGEDRLVAVLEREPDAEPTHGRLLITLSRPEAHVIFHELRAEKTLPGQTFELVAQVVTQLQGKLTAVELVADAAGKPAARLRVEGADGRTTIPTRAGLGLALAVHLKAPLLVAERLLKQEKARTASTETGGAAQAGVTAGDLAETGDVEAAPGEAAPAEQPGAIDVPDVFLRAFEEQFEE